MISSSPNLDRIAYQARRVRELSARKAERAVLPLLREKSLALLTAVVDFQRGALHYLGQSGPKKIGRSLLTVGGSGAEAWLDGVTELRRACDEYDQALLLQIASTVLKLGLAADGGQGEDEAEFRRWLTPSSAGNDARLMATAAKRAEGSLQWVVEMAEFRRWRLDDASAAAGTLWLTGLPGTGKSTISAYLCDLLAAQYPEDIVVYFFGKRGAPGLTTAFHVVRTLCYQLTRKEPFYRKYLQEKPDLPEGGANENLIFFFETLIKKPLAAGPRDRTIFMLLDGLDELEDAGQQNADGGPVSYNSKTGIEILLEQLVTLPRVKILVTSRSLPELDRVLSKSGIVRPITGVDNAADIENYVAHRVDKSPKLKSGFSELELDPIDFFHSKANGVFLWVSVVLDMLDGALSTKSFKQALGEVHPTMNSIYEDVFSRAEQKGTLSLMLEVLHWAVILPYPFTVRQMDVAAEISMGDKVFNIEKFLRIECGALVYLVPTLGSRASSDTTLEIYLGHETFQAWLGDKFGPEARRAAHGRAARTSLLYLLAAPSDDCLREHAATRWLWHLRGSMGLGDRAFAEPLTVLEGGSPLPHSDAPDIFAILYKFLSGTATESWLEYHLSREHHCDLNTFWEVHHACVEIAAWTKINKDALHDEAIHQTKVDGVDPSRLQAFRDTVSNPQTIARLLWPHVCRIWLWNRSFKWWSVSWGARTLSRLYVYTFDASTSDSTAEADELMARGHLSLHLANTIIATGGDAIDGLADPVRRDAVLAAGGYDDLAASPCAANLSVWLYTSAHWKSAGPHGTPADRELYKRAEAAIREAITDSDPESHQAGRNYFHLGKVLESQHRSDEAMEAYRAAVARDPDHLTEARLEMYQCQEDALLVRADELAGSEVEPEGDREAALDAVVALLERAIVDDPENASNRWFHHLFDVHKKRGDLSAARETYRRLIRFAPSWHTYWEQIADTYIDEDSYEKHRTFDWPAWCAALAEAASEDPSYAHAYWGRWQDKPVSLANLGHFDIAVDILAFGVETAAPRTETAAQDACAEFHFHLGETLVKAGRWEGAVAPLEEAVARSARLTVWNRRKSLKFLAWAYIALRRWDEARAAADKRLALPDDPHWGDPERHDGHGLKGDCAWFEGRLADAIHEFKSAIRMLEKEVAESAAKDSGKRGDDKNMSSDDGGGGRGADELLDERLGWYLIDLGLVYDGMGRTDQAQAMFRKALPHVQYEVQERLDMRTRHGCMWRQEGRAHARLAWLLEQLDINDPRVAEEYELALWSFRTTVYVEDDFVEEADLEEAKAALERVRRGQKWVYPGGDLFRAARMRGKIGSIRSDWANSNYQDEVQRDRRRGSA